MQSLRTLLAFVALNILALNVMADIPPDDRPQISPGCKGKGQGAYCTNEFNHAGTCIWIDLTSSEAKLRLAKNDSSVECQSEKSTNGEEGLRCLECTLAPQR